MKKEFPDFFWWAVVLLALIIFLISLVLFGLESVQSLLKEYSGILTGIIAVVVAFFTIRRQTKNVNRQISTQLRIAEKNRFLDKKQEVLVTLYDIRNINLFLFRDIKDNTNTISKDSIYLAIDNGRLLPSLIEDYGFPIDFNDLSSYLDLCFLVMTMRADDKGGIDFYKELDNKNDNKDKVFIQLLQELKELKRIEVWDQYKKRGYNNIKGVLDTYDRRIITTVTVHNPFLD